METITHILARELNQSEQHVSNVVALLDEGNTIPFIARYRKELHGSMDDTALRALEERLQYLRNLEKRREEVKGAVDGQGKLTEALAAAIDAAATLAEVEDLYRPYKQKRRTRATMAREKGLEPLAVLLFAQERDCPDPEEAAQAYIDPEKGVETAADALQDTIRELTQIVCNVVGFQGKVVNDLGKPDGAPRKLLDSSKIFALGWKPNVSFAEGIQKTYQDFLANEEKYLREGN